VEDHQRRWHFGEGGGRGGGKEGGGGREGVSTESSSGSSSAPLPDVRREGVQRKQQWQQQCAFVAVLPAVAAAVRLCCLSGYS